jgi:hypothetical protein
MQEKYYLGAYWKERKETLLEYLTISRSFLQRLKHFHNIFSTLAIYIDNGREKIVWLDDELRNLEELIQMHSISEEAKYESLDDKGTPTWLSFAPVGFSMHYSNTKPLGENNVSVSIETGRYSPWLTNSVVINLPGYDPDFNLTHDLAKQLLKIVVECWQPQIALVTTSDFRNTLKNDKFTVGWVTYFANYTETKYLPDNIERELFNNGILISTTTNLLDSSNPDHVCCGKVLRDLMRPLGLLSLQKM